MLLASDVFDLGAAPARPYAMLAVEGPAGAGKLTLARRLTAAPAALHLPLAAQTDAVFRDLMRWPRARGEPLGAVPASLVHAARLIEAAVQFRYQEEFLAGFDLVVADRWLQTWEVYCGDIGDHAEWYLQIASYVPVPDLVLYLRVSPEVAAARLARRAVARESVGLESVALESVGPGSVGPVDEAAVLREAVEACARYDEVMSAVDCVVVDADAPAADVLAEVTGILDAVGLPRPPIPGPGGEATGPWPGPLREA
ncbi:AAA family ATPase [Parafrankia discariae]|uniref:AAA family ATPase n=1 Tax=Parafrankia discariae TaxID=365528 RepID=UPI0003726BBF|nr:AAA family ATPase [Parafrankia discariae]